MGLAGILLVSIVAVVASQIFAATPPITDENGNPIPGSIATLEKVNLNGTEQWISIRGQDATKPILLHLGMGGPGGGGFATRSLFAPLEKDFVVVSWDEPGTGKSYNSMPISELTTKAFCGRCSRTHTISARTLSSGKNLYLRRLVDKHPRRLAGAGISRFILRLHRQRTDGQHHPERCDGI